MAVTDGGCVGRVAITFDNPTCQLVGGTNHMTITSVADGEVQIRPLHDDLDVSADQIKLGSDVPDGPGCLLVHDEPEDMAELLQLRLKGTVTNGVLRVESRRGSLDPQHPGLIAQLRGLRALNKAARANRTLIQHWDR